MIKINLCPYELRKNVQEGLAPEVVIGLVVGWMIILGLIHMALFGLNYSKSIRYNSLQTSWEELKPAKKRMDYVVGKLRGVREKHQLMSGLVGDNVLYWSEKFNILSDSLPKGVWLRNLDLEDGLFLIKGSAISREGREMINVHKLTSKLKENKDFLSEFNRLELDSIQRRKINTMEIADFLIEAEVRHQR